MSSTVAAVGSLGRHEVRSVLDSATKRLPRSNAWSVDCAGIGFEIRYVGPCEPPARTECRDLLVDCGRIIFDLRVAIRARGVHPTVHLMPVHEEPDLLAVVLPQGRSLPTPEDLALFDAIVRPGADRRPPTRTGVPAEIMKRLRQAAKAEQSWIATLSHEQVGTLRSGSDPRIEPDEPAPAIALEGAGQRGDPATAVIGSLRDLPTAQLRAGQALERVLLTCVGADLPATVLPNLLAGAGSRKQVRDLLGGGLWPHSVVRLGEGRAAPEIVPVTKG